MKKREDITKHTINLRLGDLEFIQNFYAPKDWPASLIIRRLISQHVDHLKAEIEKQKLEKA